MKHLQARLSRRNFLIAATAGTAATAAAVVAKKDPTPVSPPDAGRSADKGYQLTEHVRNYYRTAKV